MNSVTAGGGIGSSQNPTVILIGGRMTLEDGEELDSRQPVEGDRWSTVAGATMAGSMLWWITTSSLVDAILDSAGPDSYALVIGPRTVAEPRADGGLRRTRLSAFLSGGVSQLTIGSGFRSSHGSQQLESRFERVGSFRQNDFETVVGVDFGTAGTRWRILSGQTALLDHVVPVINPTVIVDTGLLFAMKYVEFEASHLHGNVTLVLPHSDASERHVRDVIEWMRSGRPPREEDRPFAITPYQADQVPGSFSPVPAIPVTAEFEVTGLYRDGDWRDPSNLEAAREFIQARFDLRIGIWDLAKNPSLRESLLEESPVTPAPVQVASVPRASVKRSSERQLRRAEGADAHERFMRTTKRQFGPTLQAFGWVSPVRRKRAQLNLYAENDFVLPLTEPFPVDGQVTPLAWLFLVITRRTTSVRAHAVAHGFSLRDYCEPRRKVLIEIAAPGKCDLANWTPFLWQVKGGSGDDVDWPSRITELGERTHRWLKAFEDLPGLLSESMENPKPSGLSTR